MDEQTIRAYDKAAAKIAALHDSLVPTELYELMRRYFIPQGRTADIGCGTGRDCRWLKQQGHEVIGYDASRKMLDEAQKRHSQISFFQESLPGLSSIGDNSFDNILCSAVIMHLPNDEINPALENLLRILKKGGIALLSFRGTGNASHREEGRLYTPLSIVRIKAFLDLQKARILNLSCNREDKRGLDWQTIIFKK